MEITDELKRIAIIAVAMAVLLVAIIFTEPLYRDKAYAYSMEEIRKDNTGSGKGFWKYFTELGGGPSHGFTILILMLWFE
jgi:hypothetical protein